MPLPIQIRLFFLSAILILTSCQREVMPGANLIYDLKITNAVLVDGSGAPAFQGGILIKDGLIQYVGKADLSTYQSEVEIDAGLRVVAPGFIDAHAHGEPFRSPEFPNFWTQGVTSILLGMDGDSYGMEDFDRWIERTESARLGVNIVPFIGHATAREAVGIGLDGKPSADQLHALCEWIDERLVAGAFGVSTGIEYIPGRFADAEELTAVGHVLNSHGAVMMSHVRNEDDDQVAASIQELIDVGKSSGAKVHVSHIKIVYGNEPRQARYLLARMEVARSQGVRITADVYPYVASYTGISILYPDWALPPNDFEVARKRRGELAEYLRNRVNRRNGPQATLIGNGKWAGKTLDEVAAELEMPFEEVLIDHLPPGSASAAYFVMNESVMREFLGDDHVVISSDGSPTMLHPRGYGSFAKIIRQFVNEEKYLSLEEAVAKMSGQTASIIGLDQQRGSSVDGVLKFAPRGFLKPGFAADVLIFDPSKVRDEASFENPHALASGFEYVIINGEFIIREGHPTGARAGKVLLSR